MEKCVQYLIRERNDVWMRIITLVVIITFLCPNITFASPKPAKINTLQINSAFDKDPRNNGTQDEMVAEYHRRSEGRDRDAKVTDYKIYFNPDILEGKIEKIFRMLEEEQIDIGDIEPEQLEIIGERIPDCWPALSDILGRLIKLPIRSMCGAMALVVFYFLWKNIKEINRGKENKVVAVRGRSTPDTIGHNWVEVKFSGIEGWFVIDLSTFASSYSASGYYIGKQTALCHLIDTSEKFDYGNGITMEDYRIESIDYKEKVKDSSASKYGEEKAADFAEEPLIPLELKNGTVERPAVYEYDEEFWREVEESNPGILEKVKRIIATYFDTLEERGVLGLDTDVCLKEGVDYDFISGRSVIIRLNSPVEINGVVMKEIIIKGAPFKKIEEDKEYYPVAEPTEENIRHLRESSGHIEFDSNGSGKAVPLRFDRKDAIFYYKTKNEYDVGQKGFKNSRCPINIFPVMSARYLKDKALDGGELGVVVIASPSKTVHFADWTKNRVGHLITILLSRLQDSLNQPNAEEIKEQTYAEVAEIMGAYGSVLRGFHDAGYTHGNPHSGNVVVDTDSGEVHVVDLTDARLKSEMTGEQAFGYQLRDIHYATGDFIRGINKPDVPLSAVRSTAHALRCFLIGYFGLHGLQFHFDDDFQILNYAHELDVFLTTKYHPDNPGSKLIYTDEILRVPLAHLVSRVVFEAGGFRETEHTDTSGKDSVSGVQAVLDSIFGDLPRTEDVGPVDMLRALLEGKIAGDLDPEGVFSLQTKDANEKLIFVIAPQRTIAHRHSVMQDSLRYRKFLDSQAARVLLRIYEFPRDVQEQMFKDWVDSHQRELHNLSDIFNRDKELGGLLSRFPRDLISDYYKEKEEYPGLNIISFGTFTQMDLINSAGNHPDEFVAEDVRDIVKKLKAKGIDVKVVSLHSRNFRWPRDIVTWIDSERYIESRLHPTSSISEGGMIVNGVGRCGKFVLVSEKTPDNQIAWLKMQAPDVEILPIHAGFSTIKHEGKLYHIPSAHIDSVIGFIPADLTKDGRSKLIVDPQYFELERKKLTEFANRQGLDIVFVDREELHLQMANISIIEGHIIINRGEKTIRALNLKDNVVISPDIPNTEGVFGGGLYRCQSNLLPESKAGTFKELDIDAPISTETLLHSLHLSAFCGQKPKKDVVSILADAVDKYRYDRKIIYRAFLDYAEQNNGEPPSWLSISQIVDRMAQLAHHSPTNNMQLLIREDLVDEAGNRLWREKEWTAEELLQREADSIVTMDSNGNVIFDNAFVDRIKQEFGLGEEEAQKIMANILQIFRLRKDKYFRKDFVFPDQTIKLYFVDQSKAVSGDCRDNEVAFINLKVVKKLVQRLPGAKGLLSVYLGIFLSHEILGHEVGIYDESLLGHEVGIYDESLLSQQDAELFNSQIEDLFPLIYDTLIRIFKPESLFIKKLENLIEEFVFLRRIGIKKGNKVVSVGGKGDIGTALAIAYLGGHYIGYEIDEIARSMFSEKVLSPYSYKGYGGSIEYLHGLFSYGSNTSANLEDHSVDSILMLTSVLSDPIPVSDSVSVFKEALRVVKNGGEIIVGIFGVWSFEYPKQAAIIEIVLNSSEWKGKVKLHKVGEGVYPVLRSRYVEYKVEFLDGSEQQEDLRKDDKKQADTNEFVQRINSMLSEDKAAAEMLKVAPTNADMVDFVRDKFGDDPDRPIRIATIGSGPTLLEARVVRDLLREYYRDVHIDAFDETLTEFKDDCITGIHDNLDPRTAAEYAGRYDLVMCFSPAAINLHEFVSSIKKIMNGDAYAFIAPNDDNEAHNFAECFFIHQWFFGIEQPMDEQDIDMGVRVYSRRAIVPDLDKALDEAYGPYGPPYRQTYSGNLSNLIVVSRVYPVYLGEGTRAVSARTGTMPAGVDSLEGTQIAKPIEAAPQTDKGKIPALNHEMFRQWIERGKFKVKYRFEWRIDYPSIAITSDGEVVGLTYEKNRNEWHVDFNGIGIFYVTADGEIKFRDAEDYTRVNSFIESVENAIKNPKETRKRIADFYIEQRKQLEAARARDREIIEKRGYISGLPMLIQDESALASIDDDKLHMYLFGGIYRTVDGGAFSLIYESVLNEILRRRGYLEILESCIKWAGESIVILSKNDLWQTCINVLDSAIERAGSIEQRTAITRLKASYLSNIGKTKGYAKIIVDIFLSTIRAKAQSCKDLDEELVLAIDTDIGNLSLFAQELFAAFSKLQDALALEGLDNVRIFIGNGKEIETHLEKYLAEKGDKKDYVISAVVKNKNIDKDGLFKSIKDRIQITAVDDTNIENTDTDELNYIPILSILELSIKKAMGTASSEIRREYSNIPNVEEILEQNGTLIIYLLPKVKPIPINELKERYRYEAQVLTAA